MILRIGWVTRWGGVDWVGIHSHVFSMLFASFLPRQVVGSFEGKRTPPYRGPLHASIYHRPPWNPNPPHIRGCRTSRLFMPKSLARCLVFGSEEVSSPCTRETNRHRGAGGEHDMIWISNYSCDNQATYSHIIVEDPSFSL